MKTAARRIAINIGGGYVAGLNAVISGAVLAATREGWAVAGIRDGFDGLLFPDRYPEGGLVELTSKNVFDLSVASGAALGTKATEDPFRVRNINANNIVEEVDRSDDLLAALRAAKIDAVVSIAGRRALSILFRLHRKGLKAVCVPKTVENDIPATQLSFGFNSALAFTTEMLDRVRLAAEATRKLAVVEVLGEHSGWLALQAGIAACADAVLIPEIPYDLKQVANDLKRMRQDGREPRLVVVAAGASEEHEGDKERPQRDEDLTPMHKALSPLAPELSSSRAIDRSGRVAESVAHDLQRLSDQETHPFSFDQIIKGGTPTATDRQLGLGYGVGAVRALSAGKFGVMVAYQPPDLKTMPLEETINRVRTVPESSELVVIARALGISLGKRD